MTLYEQECYKIRKSMATILAHVASGDIELFDSDEEGKIGMAAINILRNLKDIESVLGVDIGEN